MYYSITPEVQSYSSGDADLPACHRSKPKIPQ